MSRTNRFRPLSEEEQAAYEACANALSSLNEAGQYKVLKEIAMRLGRDVVKPGAVVSAAAAASARAATASGSAATKSTTGGKGKGLVRDGAEKQAFLEWTAGPGKALKACQDSLRADLKSEPEGPRRVSLIGQLKEASANIRSEFQSFRTEGGSIATPPKQQLVGYGRGRARALPSPEGESPSSSGPKWSAVAKGRSSST
jgi:hypothetical protein